MATAAMTSSADLEQAKEPPVIEEQEIQRFIDLGLGRGVDATNRFPWENKSAFKVRDVLFDKLIGTEQGGILQTYEQEVTSITVQQGKLKASIAIPHSPVDVNLDAETSRSATNTRRITGRKLVTRTVSFALRFRDRIVKDVQEPLPEYVDPEEGGGDTGNQPAPPAEKKSSTTVLCEEPFEWRLANWIIQRLAAEPHAPIDSKDVPELSKSVNFLREYVEKTNEGDDVLLSHCVSFIREFRVTHFVTSMDLGATEFQVYTEAEYMKKYGAGGGIGVSQIGNVSVSGSTSSKTTTTTTDTKKIGLIGKDDSVKRGSLGEAVVGVKLLPVTSLIQEYELLHRAMKTALLQYFKFEADTSYGPFIVSCSDKLFWKVNEDNFTLEVTDDIKQSSSFFVYPHDDGDTPDEFIIMYSIGNEEEDLDLSQEGDAYYNLKPVSRYLDTHASIWGYNYGPLKLKFNVNETDSRLVVISRTVEHYAPFGLSSFTSGEDMFYIKNARRKWSKDGFVCVQQVVHKDSTKRFVSGVLPNISYQNDETVFMLFRLLPASLRERPELFHKKISGYKGKHGMVASTAEANETDEASGAKPTSGGASN